MLLNFFPILSILLFTTNLFFPQVGFIITFFIPLLIITYLNNDKRDKRSDLYNSFALILTVFYNPFFAFYFVLIVLAPSVLLYIHTINEKNLYPVITSGVPVLFFTVLALITFPEYKEQLQQAIINNIDNISQQVASQDIPLEERGYVSYISNNKNYIANMMIMLLPSVSYLYVALLGYISRSYAYRMRGLPLTLFKVPDVLIIPFIIGGFFILGSSDIANAIANNTLIAFAALFFFQGLDLVNFFMNKFNFYIFIRLLFFIIIFSEPFMLIFVAIFGLFDNWFHFEKIKFNKDKN